MYIDVGILMNIGKYVIVGYKVMLYGCEIGDNSFIGINFVILNCVKIGKNCIIGVNFLIFEGKVILDNLMVMGLSGKVVKELID